MNQKTVVKSLAEYQAGRKEADGTVDREQELADMEAAGQLAETPTESDQEDAEPQKVKEVEDLGTAGWSDKDEAINVLCLFRGMVERAGTTDVTYELTVRAPAEPDVAADLIDALQERAYTVRYAGRLGGHGGTVRSIGIKADADGNRYMDVIVRMPENQREHMKNLVGMARTRGVLALEPAQMALDLATRAE